jgi:hypothetical protein
LQARFLIAILIVNKHNRLKQYFVGKILIAILIINIRFKLSYPMFRDIHFSSKRSTIHILTPELPEIPCISFLLCWACPTASQHLANFWPFAFDCWRVPMFVGSQKSQILFFSCLSPPPSLFYQCTFSMV